MKNWKYVEGAKVGNADLSAISKNWSKTEIDHILQNAHMFKKEVVEEAKRLKEAEKNKTGNDTPWEYAHRKPKVINDDKTGSEEFFKQLSDDVKEREEKDDKEIKLVGNETYQHKLYPNKYVIIEGNNYKIVTDGKVEKTGVLTDAVLYGINQTYKRVGNFKTGKSAIKPGDRVQSYGVQGTVRKVEGENSDNIYGEPIIEVEWDNGTVKKVGEHYLRKIGNKVGNAKDKNDKDLKVGDIVDVRGKKGKITKIIGDVIEVFYDNSGTYNPDRIDRHYADEATKVGNSKIGNEASDDKFAYVMREFDEGKLKTPDGKVVTDPAQAKAIAYSESKKTENGLARARNAMAKNKKVKNSAVREYKHPDGRVAQIDFNEDGSDADMSIYEGTKEIEQKNFSTIRDAEQYVISHGFRRII